MRSSRGRQALPRTLLWSVAPALLVTLWMILGGAGASRPSNPPPGAPGTGDAPSPSSAPGNASAYSLLGNVALANGTFRVGDLSGPNGFSPLSLAYDGIDHELFVGVGQPTAGIIVVDPLYDDEVGFWPSPGGASALPRALAFDPSNGMLVAADGASGTVTFYNTSDGQEDNSTYLGVGTDPVALALDTLGDRVAVVEASDDSVAVLNATSGSLLSVVPVGSAPDAVAYDPVAGRMIVANGGGSTVSVLDPSNGSVVGSEPVGDAPDGVAYDSVQGRVLVANRLSDNLTILGPGNLAPIGAYGTGSGPGLLSCSTDGVAVVPNSLDDNVTVVDDPTGTVMASLPTGSDPASSLWDSSEGRDYVADLGTDALTILNLTITGVEGTQFIGAEPQGIADLPPGGGFIVADTAASSLDELAASNLSEGFRTILPAPPVDVASDAALGRLIATEPGGAGAGGNVSIVNASTGAILGTFPVGKDPQGIAYDPVTRQVYVANEGSASVSVLDPLNGQLNGTFPLPSGGGHPTAVSVAVASDGAALYVTAGSSNDSVTVLNASTGAFLASIATPADPQGISDDPTDGTVWVADAAAGMVTEISEGTQRALANFSLGADPVGVAVDDPDQWVAVTAPASGIVDLLNASDGSILATTLVGSSPTAVAVDPASQHFAISEPANGSVGLLGPSPTTFGVTFQESGLPDPGAGWTVSVDGVPFVATAPNLTLAEPNGSHAYVVAPLPGLVPTPSGGHFLVQGGPLALSIAFGPPTYNATFYESGLLSGSLWTVAIGARNVSSSTTEILVALPNGTYSYRASASSAYAATGGTGSGTLTIQGGPPVPQVVQFSAVAPYELNFTETGLAAGTSWSAELGTTSVSGSGTSLTFRVDFGQYQYAVPSVDGFVADPPRGAVTISTASPPPIPIQFLRPGGANYPVAFESDGLPQGTGFQVTLNGSEAGGIGTVNFSAANGTLSFVIESPSGWSADPASGSVEVTGAPILRVIEFHPVPAAIGGTVPLAEEEIGLGIVTGAAAVVAVLLLGRRRAPPVHHVTGELVRSGGVHGAEPPTEGSEPPEPVLPIEGTLGDPPE